MIYCKRPLYWTKSLVGIPTCGTRNVKKTYDECRYDKMLAAY